MPPSEPLKYGGEKPAPAADGDSTPLLDAVWTGDCRRVRDVLEDRLSAQQSVDDVTPRGDSALHLALRLGHVDVAEALLAAGANVLLRDGDNRPTSYLAAALSVGRPEAVRTLLKAVHAAVTAEVARRAQALAQRLRLLPDFRLQVTFHFNSWVPFVSRLLPDGEFE